MLGLNIDLTGQMGRRTKYQHYDVAQLVLDITTKTVKIKKLRNTNVNEDYFNEEENPLYVM